MGRSYKESVIKQLFGGATCCAHPDCEEPLIFSERDRVKVVVEIAHIRSESPNGPRHDSGYEDVDGFDNLLLLCGTHHPPVDAHESTYSIEELEDWKAGQMAQVGQRLTADELRQILAAIRGNVRNITHAVEIATAGHVHEVEVGSSAARRWVDGLRDEAMSSLLEQERSGQRQSRSFDPFLVYATKSDVSGILAAVGAAKPDDRSPAEYTQEVDKWVNRCLERLTESTNYLVHSLLPMRLRVRNLTQWYLEAVQVRMFFPREVGVVIPFDEKDNGLSLPPAPAPYGTRSPSFSFMVPPPLYEPSDWSASLRGDRLLMAAATAQAAVESTADEHVVTFGPFHLRAGYVEMMAPIVAYTTEPGQKTIDVRWDATCTDDGVAAGLLKLGVVRRTETLVETVLRSQE